MKIGDCVVIRQNPHDSSLSSVAEHIRQILPGAGLGERPVLRHIR